MTHTQHNNWQTKTLGEICDLFTDGDWVERKDQSKNGIRLIQTGNIGSGIFKDRSEKSRYISQATFKRLRCTEIKPDDCLVSRLPDPVGRACILPKINEKMITAVDCTIIRFNKKELLNDWFIYFSLSQEYQRAIDKKISGATRQRISRNHLGKISIPLPPLPEQKRIVSVLDEAIATIEKAKENAEKNLQNSKGLFENYLVSIFNKPGGDWTAKTLGDVCQLYQGLCINAKTKHLLVEKSNFPLLRIKDLTSNSTEQFVAESGWPKNSQVNESEIIYTRTGQIGLVFRGRSGILHNNCFKVIPSPELNNEYLFWWLQNPAFRTRITILASRAAQPDITHTLFKKQPILIPPRAYQDSSIHLIDQMRERTQHLKHIYTQKLSALDELKQSLLHKAFSGEL